ncbi:Regulator of ribonuclease activity A [compost metagenome]
MSATAIDLDLNRLLNAYRGVPTPLVSDNLDRYPGAVGIKPLHGAAPLLGVAYTVRTRSGDNLAIHKALENVKPGQVIVVDGGGDESRALVGEIMMEIAAAKGVLGFAIDGAIRDVAAFAATQFPCFARSVIHRGPYKFGPGEQEVPVSIGGMPVSPGDIVIGDEDGILAISPDVAQRILPGVQEQIRREAEIIESIRNGTYTGAYSAQKTA